jgi:large conductance mechanosensitive channel
MAFILFCIVKAMNALVNLGKKKEEEKPAEDPDDIKLLKEMLAVMKEQDPEAAKRAEEKVKKE